MTWTCAPITILFYRFGFYGRESQFRPKLTVCLRAKCIARDWKIIFIYKRVRVHRQTFTTTGNNTLEILDNFNVTSESMLKLVAVITENRNAALKSAANSRCVLTSAELNSRGISSKQN